MKGLDNSDSSCLNSYIEKIKVVIDSSNNIKKSCGVTNSNVIASATIKNKADISIAFDEDGDSLL